MYHCYFLLLCSHEYDRPGRKRCSRIACFDCWRQTNFRGHLGRIFKHAGVGCEAVRDAAAAVKRLEKGEPRITGVLTDPLKGNYPKVVEAAQRVGASVVLMTHSSLTLYKAQGEEIPAYLQSDLVGRAREDNMIDSMLSDLVPGAKELIE
jgi:hypothetical protein